MITNDLKDNLNFKGFINEIPKLNNSRHIIDNSWNSSTIEQVIGRARRHRQCGTNVDTTKTKEKK